MAEIVCPLHAAAAATPDAPALVTVSGAVSFRELDNRVQATASAFQEYGVRSGERIVLVGRVDADFLIQFLALLRLGAVACPVNPRFPDAYCAELLARVNARTLPSLKGYGGQASTAAPMIPEDRPATIIFTSGSAGPPKAALHSFGNHYHSALLSNRNIALQPGDCWLLSLPIYHVAGVGILFRCLTSGAAIAVPEDKEPIETAITRYDVTHLSLVATQLYRLIQADKGRAALRRVRAVLLGGSAIPEGLLRDAVAMRVPVFTSYGLTEMASQVTTTRPGDPLDRLLTSGVPLDSGNLRISGEGEILVRGKTLFLGYTEGKRVVRPLTDDGWFATADLGFLDAPGYLTVTGRRDNLFISGGENIQPEEIEQYLCRCPGVREALVVPVPHREFGAVPVAFVRSGPEMACDEVALRQELEKLLPRYKIPRRILAWPEELTTEGMKISRIALAERASTLFSG